MFSTVKKDEIKICYDHQEYEVPLIWTFAFNGAEYWCPYCGCNEGMLGAGTNVPKTDELEKRLERYEKYSSDYLHANGVLVCSGTEWEGRVIKPHELPQEEKDRLAEIRENWKYKIKIEDV